MRFIGSKNNLLQELDTFISSKVTPGMVFCDLFSGTGTVGEYFKKDYSIISNDFMRFSYYLQAAMIELSAVPKLALLKDAGIKSPLEYLNYSEIKYYSAPFILENYSPHNDCERQYLSTENAGRIDFIRQQIELWHKQKLLLKSEYNYLIACLIEAVSYVSNIAGTYGAYLKHWDKRALQPISIKHLAVKQNIGESVAYNKNAEELIDEIKGDILYLDPPYNNRQYLPNYHLLETIACYDYPEIKGKTGLRPYDKQKSLFCSKKTVEGAFESIISRAKFEHIFISYSSEGLISHEAILGILKRYCIDGTESLYEIPYRRYKNIKSNKMSNLHEYLFYARKPLNV